MTSQKLAFHNVKFQLPFNEKAKVASSLTMEDIPVINLALTGRFILPNPSGTATVASQVIV